MIDRDRVRELLTNGTGPAEIGRILNCHPNTVHKIRTELEAQGVDCTATATATRGATPNATPPAASPVPAKLSKDPELQARERDILLLELDARRLEAEERLARLRRQSDPAPPGPGNGTTDAATLLRLEFANRFDRLERDRVPPANQVGSFVPLIQTFLTSLMTLLGQLVAKTQQAPKEVDLTALAGLAAPADSLSTVIPLIKQVLELATQIGGGGGGESSELAQILGALAPVLGSGQGQAPGYLPQPQPPGARAPQQPGQDPMQVRIATFLLAIERESRARTDPWTVAEAIERDLNLCPEVFRKLFAENGPAQILAGLARFVPEPIHARISGLMAQNAGARQWFVEFVEALHGEGPEELEEEPAADAGPLEEEYLPEPGSASLEEVPEDNGPPQPSPSPVTTAPPAAL